MRSASVRVTAPLTSSNDCVLAGTEISYVQSHLLSEFNTYIQVFTFQSTYYMRISAQIYTEMSDFISMANNVLLLLNQIRGV